MTSGTNIGKARSAGLYFILFAGAFIVFFAVAVMSLAQDQCVLLARVRTLQTTTLPQTINQQRLARNLEVLRLEGERVLFSDTTEQRKEALFVVTLIANHPTMLSDLRVKSLVGHVEHLLANSPGASPVEPRIRADWLKLSQRLTLLADDISIEGVNLGNADLMVIEEAVRLGNTKLMMTVLLAGLLIVSLLFLLRRTFIVPLQQIHQALAAMREGATPLMLPASKVAEICSISQAMEKLDVTIKDKEASQRTLKRREKLLSDMGRVTKVGGWELDLLTLRLEWTDEVFRIHETAPGFQPTLEAGIEFYATDSRPMIEDLFRQAIGKDAPFDTKLQIRTAKGNLRWIHVIGTVHHEEGLAKVLFGTVQDITEQKAFEEFLHAEKRKAEDASRAKSRFLSAASHDLRQPAHALGMFVTRLAGLPADPQARSLVNSIESCVKALQDMLDGFFDMARLDDESKQTQIVPFRLESLFEQLRSSFTSAARDKGLRLRIRPTSAWVDGDQALLHRILVNLTSNAIRYTQHGGVLVACRRAGGGKLARIEVWDSGIGIAEQHHDKIFDEFYQVDNPERDRAKGLGLGLSIVDRICRLLNYSLSMHSSLGHGTRFTLLVPVSAAQAAEKPELLPPALPVIKLDGLHLLVIEDDPLGRAALSGLLTSWGCRVTALEGVGPLTELAEANQRVDFIISDFRLGGGMNGIDAVQRVREQLGQNIGACLVSGDTDESVQQQARAAQLVLLQKPVRPAKLGSLLRRLVQTREQGNATL